MPSPASQENHDEPALDYRPSRARVIAATVLALLLLAAAAGFTRGWFQSRTIAHEPVETVREFLEASRSGDVETARALAAGQNENRDDLLTAEAASADWEIGELELEVFEEAENPSFQYDSAVVRATITGPAGASATEQFELDRVDGEWKLSHPFGTLTVSSQPVPYFEVNGFVAPLENAADESEDMFTSESVEFDVLPGLYEFYADAPEGLEFEVPALLSLGDKFVVDGEIDEVTAEKLAVAEAMGYGLQLSDIGGFTVSGVNEEDLNARVHTFLDDCLAAEDGSVGYGCPFGLGWSEISDLPDQFSIHDERSWEVLTYPEVSVGTTEEMVNATSDLHIVNRTPGLAAVTLTSEETDDTAVLECDIDVSRFWVEYDEEGRYLIAPWENGQVESATDEDAEDWDGGFDFNSVCSIAA
ncbi:DUF4878 domain-containing protein [Glycomyces buryatensis]|uniref:DUF4878 domain-containing protein n=1 Tax=Glycomyces buryatensis TaxID=2570927 RepID=A0A4S8QLX5_9ACTN|nr:DUF4878 domain-containing protein [Glycomyces buryatensis]THV42399.1 DUF4878 domain-containing protein [Glycomyces buryatensis]